MADTFETLDLHTKATSLERLTQRIREVGGALARTIKHLFVRDEGIGTTERQAHEYKQLLFPEQETVEDMLELLRDHYTVDVGSGATHRVPDGLPTLLTERFPQSIYKCVDPRLGFPIGHPQGFESDMQTENENLFEVIGNSRAELVAAMGEKLPFPDASVDFYLSCYCMPWHFTSAKALFPFFEEIQRVLKIGGEARLGPLSQKNLDMLTKNQGLRKFLHDHFDVQLCRKTYDENDIIHWVDFDYTMRLVKQS